MVTGDPTELARPSKAQLEWHEMELEMFVHLGPATWQNRQYNDLSTPLSDIDPSKLDTEQWADAAESFGAKQIVLVAKHTGGFCWWQTNTSSYGVKETPWRGGRGDLVKELSATCRRRGLRLGVYLSPQDRNLGTGVKGVADEPRFQPRYNEIYRQQLTELLTRYGEINEVWFDGSSVVDTADIIERHAPHAVVFQGREPSLRWVGTERGFAPYPLWNAVDGGIIEQGVAPTGRHGTPDGDYWLPPEVDTTLRDHYWFHNRDTEHSIKSLDHLMEVYYRSVGHGCVLLLNASPDTRGVIPDPDLHRYAEFGNEIRRRFSEPLSEANGHDRKFRMSFPEPTHIDHLVSKENIADGQHIREYRIDGRRGSCWFELARGTSIGYKKIDWFPETVVDEVCFASTVSAGAAPEVHLSAFCAGDPYPGHNLFVSSGRRCWIVREIGPDIWLGSRRETYDGAADQLTLSTDLTPYLCDYPAGTSHTIEIVKTHGASDVDVSRADIIADAVPVELDDDEHGERTVETGAGEPKAESTGSSYRKPDSARVLWRAHVRTQSQTSWTLRSVFVSGRGHDIFLQIRSHPSARRYHASRQ